MESNIFLNIFNSFKLKFSAFSESSVIGKHCKIDISKIIYINVRARREENKHILVFLKKSEQINKKENEKLTYQVIFVTYCLLIHTIYFLYITILLYIL